MKKKNDNLKIKKKNGLKKFAFLRVQMKCG